MIKKKFNASIYALLHEIGLVSTKQHACLTDINVKFMTVEREKL